MTENKEQEELDLSVLAIPTELFEELAQLEKEHKELLTMLPRPIEHMSRNERRLVKKKLKKSKLPSEEKPFLPKNFKQPLRYQWDGKFE